MNSWQQAAVLMLILLLGLVHVDKYKMTPLLALTLALSYLWLTWLFLLGIWNFLETSVWG